jgi:hypothetical protein
MTGRMISGMGQEEGKDLVKTGIIKLVRFKMHPEDERKNNSPVSLVKGT